MVNLEIMRNPLNWLIIWLMLLIAAIAGKHTIRLIQQFGPKGT